MILSDREIIAALKRQFIRITPEPTRQIQISGRLRPLT